MNKFKEALSNLCHEQWSGWMKYLFSKCEKTEAGEMIIPKWAVDRWERQMNTNYENLSEEEKNSDRTEADKFIKIIKKCRSENAVNLAHGIIQQLNWLKEFYPNEYDKEDYINKFADDGIEAMEEFLEKNKC